MDLRLRVQIGLGGQSVGREVLVMDLNIQKGTDQFLLKLKMYVPRITSILMI